VRWPGVTGLTSYLSGCVWLTSQRCCFDIAGVLEGTDFCRSPFPSRCARSVCLAFRRLSFGGSRFFRNRQSHSSVLIHSSNRLPSGNCDSLEFETSSSYLTEFGTVSNRSSSLSPFFAFTDSARTLPEELVNSASFDRLPPGSRGVKPTSVV
jgi:hypothetical protein